jgi:UDP-3-O-[3-hydroxymyristoyl] glucosamine N-acyltransferase
MIGKFCEINTLSCVSHDCAMKDFSSVAIGQMMAGGSSIGFRTSLSMKTSSKERKNYYRNDCIIGANGFVNNNLRSNGIAYGSPAISVSHQENPQDNAP